MPNVSVVIPTYNSAKFLVESINSVLDQNYKDYEIIVIDDGSTDNTKEVLMPFMSKIRYIFKENGGPASARNMGISQSKGKYIAFLDSDDLWLPEKLELQISMLEKRPDVGLVHSDATLFDESGKLENLHKGLDRKYLHGDIFPHLFTRNFIMTLTVIAKKECFENVGLFDKNLLRAQDYDMWLRISNNFGIGYIDGPLAMHRDHGEQISKNTDKTLLYAMKVIEKTIENCPDIESKIGYPPKHRFAALYFSAGYDYFERNNSHQAREHFLTALSYKPLDLKISIYCLSTLLGSRSVFLMRRARQRLRNIF